MWHSDVLDKIISFFPDNGNGSRIVITSRHIGRGLCSYTFSKNLLNKENSWKLVCAQVFGEDGCPSELEGVGKKNALSIVVIGGYLSKSSRKKEYWEDVSDNVNSILVTERMRGV